MNEQVTITINEQTVSVNSGTTILKAAEQIGIIIPTICYHDFCSANALCRICVVEVEGSRGLIPACVAKVNDGMKIHTESERVIKSRKTILELLASTVDLDEAPEILEMMQKYNADPLRFSNHETRTPPPIDDNPMYIRDYAKCILCWRCVQVCAEDAQFTYAINFSKRGFHTEISTFYDIPLMESTCVFCGQCVGVCPTNALVPKKEWLLSRGNNPDQIMMISRSQRNKTFSSTTRKGVEK